MQPIELQLESTCPTCEYESSLQFVRSLCLRIHFSLINFHLFGSEPFCVHGSEPSFTGLIEGGDGRH